MNPNDAVLITGGYGVVGQQFARLVRQHHPDLPLLLGGRNPAQGEALARELTCAQPVALDVTHPTPLNGYHPRAVVSLVNDPNDYVLRQAVQDGLAYLDITRWTDRLKSAAAFVSAETLRAPLLFASAWMAGIAALAAVALARLLKSVDTINISILYALKDKAGPNSTEYMDRLASPYPVMVDGAQRMVMPFRDPLTVTFPGGYQTRVYRFDTPDQFTLPGLTGARTVAARIAFDDALSTNLMVFLTRSGIWSRIRGERFTGLRRGLLYHPGPGAPHEMVVEVTGADAANRNQRLRAEIVDPHGQTHLTAVGALIQLERLLGLDGLPAPAPGFLYPDSAPALEHAFDRLAQLGVSVQLDTGRNHENGSF